MTWDDVRWAAGYAILSIIAVLVGYAIVWVWKGIVK